MTGDSEYLLVLYRAERRSDAPVSPGAVADAVGRSPAATTEMLQRLDDRGLVAHEPYEGATLTADGRARAEELHETFVTLSQFVTDSNSMATRKRRCRWRGRAARPSPTDSTRRCWPIRSRRPRSDHRRRTPSELTWYKSSPVVRRTVAANHQYTVTVIRVSSSRSRGRACRLRGSVRGGGRVLRGLRAVRGASGPSRSRRVPPRVRCGRGSSR
jgi:DtxR family Mn-dependent transcriptional regulator